MAKDRHWTCCAFRVDCNLGSRGRLRTSPLQVFCFALFVCLFLSMYFSFVLRRE